LPTSGGDFASCGAHGVQPGDVVGHGGQGEFVCDSIRGYEIGAFHVVV
jgi:hypothetical protein